MERSEQYIRDCVERFASEGMIERLLDPRNMGKGDWRKDLDKLLMLKLIDEVNELRLALKSKNVKDIKHEAADVANFAMMIYDKYASLGKK